jgi:hypothetical protein
MTHAHPIIDPRRTVAEAIELCVTSERLVRDAILARARAEIAVHRSRARR